MATLPPFVIDVRFGHKRTLVSSKSCPKSEGSRCYAVRGRNVLVFDNYVAFQELLDSCHSAFLPMSTVRFERYFGCPC